ncbi:YDG domain-containing protein [Nitratireductor sp. ZSWI3]|uniref:YDG domain-containing protein n=1 Tax=Nitratireductor sp. ZSWI3 TaxID=2966359 RepID=UPI0021501A6A|nr:YDG domain-containing protein [Nitratireductor sp. ZSWI3]MCR4267287.1 YDG domain-containing protein [Nitratireductor sp. ZSWI3]
MTKGLTDICVPDARTRGRTLHKGVCLSRALTASLMLTTALVPAAAIAGDVLPSGGEFTAGNGTISASGPRMDIRQTTQSGIISWNGFSVGSGNRVHFDNGNGATLNRVTGNVSSRIDGSLTATGSVFLVNPAGVVVGGGGMVATGGSFAASTHDVTDTDFLNGGGTTFSGTSTAEVVNAGTIRSAQGDIALIARRVENTGTLEAPNGTAGLAAGYEVLMKDSADADGLLSVQLGGPDTEAVNSGTIAAANAEIRANGGNVYALAGNTDGVVKATGVTSSGGRIFLTAGSTGKVKVTGRLKARTLPKTAPVPTPRPATEGGSVTVAGGDIAISGTIDVSAETSGAKGGMVTAIASSGMSFSGTIEAKGGAGGSGGFVETSGESISIADTARVTTLADGGEAGTWLIDPNDLTIAESGGDMTGATIAANLAGGNVKLSSNDGATDGSGDIFVNDAISWTADTTLTLNAVRNVEINDTITATGTNAGLALTYGGGYSFANGGRITLSGDSASLSLNGNDYTLIHDVNDLQAISGSGLYALAETIDASGTTSWNSGAGFNPISGFSGTLAGLGNTIDSLTINRPGEAVVGMFSSTSGGFRDFTLSNVSIVSGGSVGALAYRFNAGQGASNIHVTGTITSLGGGGQVGGLVGWSDQTAISNSSSTATVMGFGEVGGLVGRLRAASITNSYATGAVTGTTDYVGGLVGSTYQGGMLTNVYASGNVTGTTNVGGLVGGAILAGAVTATNAYWDVDSTGQSTSFAGTGIGNANAFTQSTYSGFDFTNTWVLIDGETRPMLQSEYSTTIFTPHQLQLMALDLGADYTLGADLDMTGAFAANSGGYYGGVWSSAGFDPIGIYSANPFTGSLDGQGHTISGLTIDRPGEDHVGLFAVTENAEVKDLNLSGGSIIGDRVVGALAGDFNGGSITSVSSDISVEGSEFVGGLVGSSQQFTAISLASASGDVSGSGDAVGGLIGALFDGTLSRSYATGSVSGNSLVGGLVGANGYASGGGTIDQSFATGNVTGSGYGLGGLVGGNEGAISNAYAMGNVTSTGASSATGGFVGVVFSSASIENAYATGMVTGAAPVGGFAGSSGADASAIKSAYWNTETSGQANGIVAGGGDITGLTTAGLQGVLPSGFSNAVWGTGTNLYPYFNWLYPTGASAVSGFAYSDGGTTALTGAEIGIVSGGSFLGSTGTGANGYYYYLALPGALDASGALTYLDGGSTQSATYSDRLTASGISGADIWGNTFRIETDAADLNSVSTALDTTIGSFSDSDLDFINNIPGSALRSDGNGKSLDIDLDASSDFSLNQSMYAGGGLTVSTDGTFSVGENLMTLWAIGGDLTVNGDLAWANSNQLNLYNDKSNSSITINGSVTAANGKLRIDRTGSATNVSSTATGDISVGLFRTDTNWSQVGSSLPDFYAGDFSLPDNGQFLRALGGDGSEADPYRIFDLYGLQGITARYAWSANYGVNYQLVADIDASGTRNWNSGAGFAPVLLGGSLDGNGHTIDGLFINRPDSWAGLISYWSDRALSGAPDVEIKDLSITNADVTGSSAGIVFAHQSAGYQAAHNLSNIFVSGSVTSTRGSVGGIAASVWGNFDGHGGLSTISNVHADVSVTALSGFQAGGLFGTGNEYVTILDSSATGTIDGAYDAGGLIGDTYDHVTIRNSYSTVTVTGSSSLAGGLVGSASSGLEISNSFNAGNVSGQTAGGLVGYGSDIRIFDAYSSGAVTATGASGSAGGIVGYADRGVDIRTSYATGAVTGATAGGLVGAMSAASNSIANSVWDVETTGQSLAAGNAGSGTLTNVDGATSAEMKQLSTFIDHGFDVDDEGATGAAWRIYEGYTAPLLRSFMTGLTVTGGNSTRTYDGSATSSDVGTLVYGSPYDSALIFGTAGYLAANADAGVYTGGDLTLSGLYSSQFGYDLTLVSGSLAITPKALTVSVDADSKIYDGTTAATGSFGSLSGLIGGDVVNVSGSASFAFSDKNVGTGKTVTVSGLGLTGVDAGNYTLSSTATTTANITPKALTVTALANDKVYDGTTAGTGSIGALSGLVSGDMVAVSGGSFAFSDKNVGTGKAVTVTGIGLTGADAGNYTLSSTATTTANITPKALTVTALANDKVYDGTTAGTGSIGALSGLVSGDMVAVSGGSFAFADKNVGTGKTVTVSGLGLTGADAGNYTIASTATSSADITPATLWVAANAGSMTYGDGAPTLGYTYGGLVGGDDASVLAGALTSSAASTSNVGSYGITQGSLSAGGNYQIAFIGANVTVMRRAVTVQADDLQRDINEANPALTYTIVSGTLVNGDQLSGNLSTVADANSPAGTYDIDQGSLALSANYELTYLGGVLTILDEPGVPTPTVQPQTFESSPPLPVEAGDGTTDTCEPVIVRENGPIAVHPCNRTYGAWLSAVVE